MDAATEMLAEPNPDDTPDDESEAVAEALPQSHRIMVFAKDDGRRVRFISDTVEVHDGEQVDVWPFDTDAQVQAFNRALAQILGNALAPNPGGWHAVTGTATLKVFLDRLFRAAQNAAWADQGLPGRIELDASFQPPTTLPEAFSALLAEPVPVGITALPVVPVPPPADVVVPMVRTVATDCAKRSRAARVWTRERDRALVELVLTGNSAKETADDPRMTGVSIDSIYHRASEVGLSFRASSQITVRGLSPGELAFFDRKATSCQKTRDGYVRMLLSKIARNPELCGQLLNSGF